jgi:hypothetical protein
MPQLITAFCGLILVRSMNAIRHPANELLFLLQVLVALVIGVIALVIFYRAYRQTRFIAFVWLIVGSLLSLLTGIVWDVFGHYRPYPSIYVPLVLAYRIAYIVESIIGIIGTVLLVREFVRLYHARKT